MQKVAIAFLVLITCVASALGKQNKNQQEKQRVFVVPPETLLYVTPTDPNCPIEFLNPQTFCLVEGGAEHYQFRNRGTKPIVSYKIAIVYSGGGEATSEYRASVPSGWLMPGEIRKHGSEEVLELVPLTEELRQKQKIDEKLKAVIFLVVVRAEYAGGSVYDDEKPYKALTEFFDKNAIDPASN